MYQNVTYPENEEDSRAALNQMRHQESTKKRMGSLGDGELVCEETCERKLDAISKAWKVGVSSFPFFFGRENGRKWQYWSMRTYFRHLDCRRFEFYLVVSGCGSTKLWKRRGTHTYIQKYTHIHASDFSRNVRTNCLTLDLRGKSTPRREWWNPGNPFIHHFRVYLKILETLESCSLRP